MKNIFNSLFFRIALIFTLILGGLAIVLVNRSASMSEDYYNEISQKLNRNVAKYIVDEVKGLYDGKEVNGDQIGVLMHHVMATNPSTEVYLLDLNGQILKHVAMDKIVKAESVSLAPINKFIESEGDLYIKGDDPKEIGGQKIFSAAPYYFNDEKVGYIYTIVGGRDYDAVVEAEKGSYMRKLNEQSILYSTLVALSIGLLLTYFLTRNFNKLTKAFKAFQNGDLGARVKGVDGGELGDMAKTYNNMADTIQKNIEDLKGVDNLRKELIANISHDLRTPIASIQGYAETLAMKGESLNEQDRKYVDIVIKNSQRLKKLVEDLFELSKLEAKQRKFEPEKIQLAELIQDIADKYRLITNERGININTVYSKNLPLVEVDIALLDRALQNIIDNAIKFCKPGDVITIELSNENNSIRTRISDTGAGIKEEDLPHIFERYRKGNMLDYNKKGSGLGLAIVKKIMELHNTTVHVQSKVSKGTSFYFDLPLNKTAA